MKPRQLPSFMDYRPEPLLKRPAHIPEKARFPVIDAHNHLFNDTPADQMVSVMDQVGVRVFVNLTGNCILPFGAEQKGYTISRRDLQVYKSGWMGPRPDRFACFTMAEFARWDDFTLDLDGGFAEACVAALERDVSAGALGLKVTKELGLRFHRPDGSMIRVNDQRLYPIWKRAGDLGLPVLIHSTDPVGFFLPVDRKNEHYPTLLTYPGWSFHGADKWEILSDRSRMIADHPGTTFILPHVANNPEDLDWVSDLLERLPNVCIDFSARMDELGRQPYSARDFLIRWQDRVLFGADMPVSAQMYRAYFRFLETADEYFDYPGYVGEFDNFNRWKIYGLHLPDDVLRKIYNANALRVIPGLKGIWK